MVRKSISSRGSKASSKSIFEVKFEAVLIVVLIVVAILLVCFINKKFSREQFYATLIREHMYSEGNTSATPPNTNQLPDYYEGFDLTGSNLPSSLNELTGKHVFVLLGPSWCGHSKNYLRDRHPGFVSALSEIKKEHLFYALDVDIKDNSSIIQEVIRESNVNALPSLFLFENGKFRKVNLEVSLVVDFLRA